MTTLGRALGMVGTVRRAPLWTVPPIARGLLLAVIVAGYGTLLVMLVATPFPTSHAPVLLLVFALGVAQIEINRGIEKVRWSICREKRNDSLHDMYSLWGFAGILVAASSWAVLLAVVMGFWHHWRVSRIPGRPMYRALYARATDALGGLAVVGILSWASSWAAAGGVRAVLVLVAAMVAFIIVNTGLISVAMHVVARVPWRETTNRSELVLEAVTMSLSALLAALLSAGNPWLVFFVFPVVMFLNRVVGLSDFERAPEDDGETGLLTASGWYLAVRRALRKVERRHQALAVLVLDIDELRTPVGSYGAAERLATDLPSLLLSRAGPQDVLGWTERHQIGVLLHDPEAMEETAQSLAAALAEFRPADADGAGGRPPVRAAVGGARFPDDGGTMEELLDAAHAAVRAAAEMDGSRVALRRPVTEVALERYRAVRAR